MILFNFQKTKGQERDLNIIPLNYIPSSHVVFLAFSELDTLAELNNCKLQTKFENGLYKDDCEVVVDNWSPGTTESIVYHVSDDIGSSKRGITVEFIVSIESIKMLDNDYIGDN